MSITLYCLPCAGASATMYLRWRRRLPPHIEVRPLELPGRGSRLGEPLCTDAEALVEILRAELTGRLAAPFALFGHSMGALLAFELAHRLTAAGTAPACLIVAGCPAPTQRDHRVYAELRTDAQLLKKLDELRGTPPEVFADLELLRLTLDILAADFQICGNYRSASRPPLPAPLHVLGGRDDDIAPGALEAWAGETRAQHTLTLFDGGHFFIQSHEAAVLEHLQNCLAPYSAAAVAR